MWSRFSKALPNLQLGVSSTSHPHTPSPSQDKPAPSSWKKVPSSSTQKMQPASPPTPKIPPDPKQPFCCPSHQIPNHCPESNLLANFLHALATRRQQLSTSFSSPSTPQLQPLFPPVSSLLKRSDITTPSIHIVEYETIVSSPSNFLNRTYHQRYFLSLPSPSGLNRNHPEFEDEDSFVELTIEQYEAMRDRLEGEWAFLSKDEVPKERVGWKCRECGWEYCVRLREIEFPE
ncbi:hypothetical protein BDZ45DRAFT_728641 [Acephala macrosclerotiorum]|nr:hypothetical protein BDZ45DRAFT_728641 [Acephala macrosclerotiorum]